MSRFRKGFTRSTKNPACPFAVGGYESRREAQNKQQLMRNPAAPCMATYWVSNQKSAEGIVPWLVEGEGPNAEMREPLISSISAMNPNG